MRFFNQSQGAADRHVLLGLVALFSTAFAHAAEPLPVEEVIVVGKRLSAPAGEVIEAAVRDDAADLAESLRLEFVKELPVLVYPGPSGS